MEPIWIRKVYKNDYRKDLILRVDLKCKKVGEKFFWLQGLNDKDEDNLQIFKILSRSLHSPSNHFEKSLKYLYANTLNLNTESLRFF